VQRAAFTINRLIGRWHALRNLAGSVYEDFWQWVHWVPRRILAIDYRPVPTYRRQSNNPVRRQRTRAHPDGTLGT